MDNNTSSYAQFTGPRRSTLYKILMAILGLITVGSAVALALSYLAPCLNPYKYWWIAFLGLITPLLMLLNLILLFGLGVRLSKLALFPLAALLIGIGTWGNFVQLRFSTKYPPSGRRSPLEFSILSYNVHNFKQYGDINRTTITPILDYIVKQDPDIICFQEFLAATEEDKQLIEDKLEKWKHKIRSYDITTTTSFIRLAIFSKYPFAGKPEVITIGNDKLVSLRADLAVNHGKDTISLFNNHLQSTHFNQLNRTELRQAQPDDAVRTVGTRLRDNYLIRALQADTLRMRIDESPRAVVVAGDFNDTPMSYVVNTIKGKMYDTFRQSNTRYGYTYRPMMEIFRIDYVFHSKKQIETIDYLSPDLPWSDHNPVIVKLKLEKE